MVHSARGGDNPLIEHGWEKHGDLYVTKKGKAEVSCLSPQKRIYEANPAGLEQLKTEQIIRVFDESVPGEVQAYVEHSRGTDTRDYEVYYKHNPFTKTMDKKNLDKVGRYVVTIFIKDDETVDSSMSSSTQSPNSSRDNLEKQ